MKLGSMLNGKIVLADVFEISEQDWEKKFKDYGEYDYKDSHDYCQYNMYGLDIIVCISCNAQQITDKKVFASCDEKKMHDALQ